MISAPEVDAPLALSVLWRRECLCRSVELFASAAVAVLQPQGLEHQAFILRSEVRVLTGYVFPEASLFGLQMLPSLCLPSVHVCVLISSSLFFI